MTAATFGKPGRPREDRLLRQREIFLAVAPIIQSEGVRAVTMKRAATAASMSVGGIYHYFPDRRSLLLHGAQPEAGIRMCGDFFDGQPYVSTDDPWRLAAQFLEFQLVMARLVRPAIKAALELGADEFRDILEAGLERGTTEYMDALRRVLPDHEQRDVASLGRALKRTIIASILDQHATDDELRETLRALMARSFRRSAGTSPNVPVTGSAGRH